LIPVILTFSDTQIIYRQSFASLKSLDSEFISDVIDSTFVIRRDGTNALPGLGPPISVLSQ
jgi:hypothetical protein